MTTQEMVTTALELMNEDAESIAIYLGWAISESYYLGAGFPDNDADRRASPTRALLRETLMRSSEEMARLRREASVFVGIPLPSKVARVELQLAMTNAFCGVAHN